MKKKKIFFPIFFLLLFINDISFSNNSDIGFIDVEKIIYNSTIPYIVFFCGYLFISAIRYISWNDSRG